jgi:hypothetical protein
MHFTTQDFLWSLWARGPKWKHGYLWLVVSMCVFSPFLAISLYFKCNLNGKTSMFKKVNLECTQRWDLILALPSTTFFNSGDEELTFTWWLVLQAFPCHHLCLSKIPLPIVHWRLLSWNLNLLKWTYVVGEFVSTNTTCM